MSFFLVLHSVFKPSLFGGTHQDPQPQDFTMRQEALEGRNHDLLRVFLYTQ